VVRTAKAVAALFGLYRRAAWMDRRAPLSDDWSGSGGRMLNVHVHVACTAIAVPMWVGLSVLAGLFLDTAWDATPALLPSAIGSPCVAATSCPTLPVGAQPTWSHAVLQTLVMPLCDLANRSVLSPRVFPRLFLTQPLCVLPAHLPLGVCVCNPFRAAPARVFLCCCHGIHSLQPTDALARPAPRAWPRLTDGTCDGLFSGRHDGSGAELPSSA